MTSRLCMQIVDLDLSANQLSGMVPNFPNLQYLDLSGNRFTELSAVPITLQLIYLSNNNLTGNILQLVRELAGGANLGTQAAGSVLQHNLSGFFTSRSAHPT